MTESLRRRAAVFAALGDPTRLAVVDALRLGDRTGADLRRELDIESNLLAHHLDRLVQVGLVERRRGDGDGRRRYLRLVPGVLGALDRPGGRWGSPIRPAPRVVFVCTANSARSQLAAALWHRRTGCSAESAGHRPAARVHPGAVRAARRAGLDLGDVRPRGYDELPEDPADVVVAVCDLAWESGPPPARVQLHWSIPDPVVPGDDRAFDAVVAELAERVTVLAAAASSDAPDAPAGVVRGAPVSR